MVDRAAFLVGLDDPLGDRRQRVLELDIGRMLNAWRHRIQFILLHVRSTPFGNRRGGKSRPPESTFDTETPGFSRGVRAINEGRGDREDRREQMRSIDKEAFPLDPLTIAGRRPFHWFLSALFSN